MEFGTLIAICILVIFLAIFFSKSFRKRKHKKHHPKCSYIAPTHLGYKSGWGRAKHISRWVKARTIYAPDYEPQQGIHYYPYCRGRHFEYVYDGNDVYKRKLHKH